MTESRAESHSRGFEELCEILKQKKGCDLPKYLQNAMKYNGFDDLFSIQLITSNEIDLFEDFIKNKVKKYIKPAEDNFDYYHMFHDNVDQFEILHGHRMKLLDIAKFVKEKLATKDGVQFFTSGNKRQNKEQHEIGSATESLILEASLKNCDSKSLSCEKSDLTERVCNWMKNYAEQLYSKRSEYLEQGMIEVKSEIKILGTITCPICKSTFKVSRKLPNDLYGMPTWSISNFERHVKLCHSDMISQSRKKVADKSQEYVQTDRPTNQGQHKIEIQFINASADDFDELLLDSSSLGSSESHINTILVDNNNINSKRIREDDGKTSITADKAHEICSNVVETNEITQNQGVNAEDDIANIAEITNQEMKNTEAVDETVLSIPAQNQTSNDATSTREVKKRKIISKVKQQLIGEECWSPRQNSLQTENLAEVSPKLNNASPTRIPVKPKLNPFFLLNLLLTAAKINENKNKHGYRHDRIIVLFAAYLKMIAGLLAYETLHANMTCCLPSVTTVDRFLQQKGPHIVEGTFRFKELRDFLVSRNLPLRVYMSEDGTRIIPNLSYDPSTNQLVGIVLPMDMNGMPIPMSFLARTAEEIEAHFNNENNILASYAYTIMIEPVKENAPKFCLAIFGTDNKFKACQVTKRWNWTTKKLKKYEIVLDGIASDGDARLLKAMKRESGLGTSDKSFLNCKWYSCGGLSSDDFEKTVYTQDATHIITKFRNRVLKKSRLTPFGDKVISTGHLNYLINNVSKDKHLLTHSDVEPRDRQNYKSAEKISSLKTIECLLKYVPGSEGTALYLKIMNFSTSPFLDEKLSAKERVYRMWFAVFVLRIWRSWILQSNDYSLREHFVSSNCYTCVELNAHSIVKQIIKAKSLAESASETKQESSTFVPTVYGSQPCESLFRQLRSMTTTFSTVVNCSMLGMVHRINRIHLQSDIIRECAGKIIFPRFEQKEKLKDDTTSDVFLPSKEEIIDEIERAKFDAISEVTSICKLTDMKINYKCQVIPSAESLCPESDSETEDEDSDDEADEDLVDPEPSIEEYESNQLQGMYRDPSDQDLEPCSNRGLDAECVDPNSLGVHGQIELRDYSKPNFPVKEDGPFAVMTDNSGKECVFRKSSICWLLSTNKYKLSADRLQRVKECDVANVRKTSARNQQATFNLTVPFKSDEVSVGDWCLFSYDEEVYISKPNSKHWQALALSGTNSRATETLITKANKKSVKTKPQTSLIKNKKSTQTILETIKQIKIRQKKKMKNESKKVNKKEKNLKQKATRECILIGLVLSFCNLNGTNFSTKAYYKQSAKVDNGDIGVLCSWFQLEKDGTLKPYKTNKHKFINISHYKATIAAPSFEKNRLYWSEHIKKPVTEKWENLSMELNMKTIKKADTNPGCIEVRSCLPSNRKKAH